jgi:hypothetical protein
LGIWVLDFLSDFWFRHSGFVDTPLDSNAEPRYLARLEFGKEYPMAKPRRRRKVGSKKRKARRDRRKR